MLDTAIHHVSVDQGLLIGMALTPEAPGPGIFWDAKSLFSWPEKTPLFWCHQAVQIGECKLAAAGDAGVLCVARIVPELIELTKIVSGSPNDFGFSVKLDSIEYFGKTAHVQRAVVVDVSLSCCPASFWHRRNVSAAPAYRRPTAQVMGPTCCLLTGEGRLRV